MCPCSLALLKHRPDWTLLAGPEELLLQCMAVGGHGGANFFPRLYVALYEACRAGEIARARDLQAKVQEVCAKIYRVGRHPSAVIKGIKCAASCLGLCGDFMAEPFHKFREPEHRQIEQAMRELQEGLALLGR